jgi:general secretion pathway protein C
MHLAIRRYAWIPSVLLVAATALSAVRFVNLTLEAILLPAAPGSPCARSSVPRAPGPAPMIDVAGLSRITGLPLETLPERDASGGTLRTALRIRLLGTLLSVDSAWSIASLLDLTRQKTRTVMVGDAVEDSRVLEILRDRVVITRHGRREVIDLAPGEGVLGPPGDWMTDSARMGGGIRAVDESHYEVPRTQLEAALNHLEDLARDVHIVPASGDGQPRGFKVFAIRPGSLFAQIGLRDGDVLRRINGFELNTVENAFEAYTRLRSANRIDVDLERNGSSIRKSYSVR